MRLIRLLFTTCACAITIAAALLFSPLLTNAMALQLSLPELVSQSDTIAVGKITGTSASWDAGHTRISTSVIMQVEEFLKGEGGSEINITVPGGTVDGITEWVSDVPVFTAGEDVVVFLNFIPSGAYEVCGGTQGKFVVTDGKIGTQTLAEFKKEVLEIVYGVRGPTAGRGEWVEAGPITLDLSGLEFTPAAPVVDTRADRAGWQTVLNDGFEVEGAFPGSWTVSSPTGTPSWGRVELAPGSHVVWCAGEYTSGNTYADNMNAWMVCGQFDLSDASTAELIFNYWVKTEADCDFLKIAMSTDGSNFYSYRMSGQYPEWYQDTFNLRNYWSNLNLCGDSSVWLAFAFTSDESVTDTGVFLDNIQIRKYTSPIPQIVDISPAKTSAGTNSAVTITGLNFGTTPGTLNFFYRSGKVPIPGNVTAWSNTSITAIVPTAPIDGYPASASSGPVFISNSDGAVGIYYPFEVSFSNGGIKWDGTNPVIPFKVNPNATDCSGEEIAFQNAAATWSGVTNKNFSFTYSGTSAATVAGVNGLNEICWVDLGNIGTVARAWVLRDESTSTIIETDIEFNEYYNWSTATTPPTGYYDVESIALHELGHWLNLRDLYGNATGYPQDSAKVMFGMGSTGETKRVLNTDDIAGIRWIYPTPPFSATFDGWYVNDIQVTQANISQTVTGKLRLSGGASGTYILEVWRDIDLWPDVKVEESTFSYDGTSFLAGISFIPPTGDSGYHLTLVKGEATLWDMPNTFPPRLYVDSKHISITSISFSDSIDVDKDNYYSEVNVIWDADLNFGSALIKADIYADAGVLDPEIYLGSVTPYTVTGTGTTDKNSYRISGDGLSRNSFHITIKLFQGDNFLLEQDSEWILLESHAREATLSVENIVVQGAAISGFGGLEVSYDLVNKSQYTITGFSPEIRVSNQPLWDDSSKFQHWLPNTTVNWNNMEYVPGERFRISNVIGIPSNIPYGSTAYVMVGSVRDTNPGTEEYGPYEVYQVQVKDELLIIPAVPPQPGDILFKSSFNGLLTWFITTFENGQAIVQGDLPVSNDSLRNQMGDWVPGHAGLVVPDSLVPESYKQAYGNPLNGVWVFESNPTSPYLLGSGGPDYKHYNKPEEFGGEQYKTDTYNSHYLGARYIATPALNLPARDWLLTADTAGYGIFSFQQLSDFKGLGYGPNSKGEPDYNGINSYTCVGLTEKAYELTGIDNVNSVDEESWPIALSPYKQWLSTVPRLDTTARAGSTLTFNVYGVYHADNVSYTELQSDLSGLPVSSLGDAKFIDPAPITAGGIGKIFEWKIPANVSGDYYVTFVGNHNGVLAQETVKITVPSTPPSITTNTASNITINSAALNGELSDKGIASSVQVSFQWGATPGSYSNETSPAQSLASPGTFTFNLTGLTPNTTYYYRAKAVGDGTSYGGEQSFKTLNQYTLTIGANPAGSGTTNPAVGSYNYTEGTLVNISTSATQGWQFTGWSGEVANAGSASTTVIMNGNKTVTANFTRLYTLTMTVNGTGTTSPAVGTHSYPESTVVDISASPGSGWSFMGWSGEVTNANAANTTVIVTGDKIVTANFISIKAPDILMLRQNAAFYEGRTVTLSGQYRGWQTGFGTAPVTRSDWVIQDDSGAIYVTGNSKGLNYPTDIGKSVSVTGVVRLKEGEPYLVISGSR